MGACLRRSKFEQKEGIMKRKCILLFCLCAILLLIGNAMIYLIMKRSILYMIEYISPFILIMGVTFLMFMNNLRITDKHKIIMNLSVVTFDVYIIHSHILIMDELLNMFTWIGNIPIILIPLAIIGSVLVIFIFCSLVGMIRYYMFKKLKLNSILKLFAKKIDNKIYTGLD